MLAGLDYDSMEVFNDNQPMLLAIFDEFMVRTSPSGRGVHVLVKFDDELMMLGGGDSGQVQLAIRALCGDDPQRILWDSHRLKTGQRVDRLFDYKDGNQAGEWGLVKLSGD